MDFRKIVVIIIIAVLFAIFTNSLADAIWKQPKYEDYCNGYGGKYPATVPIDSRNCTYISPTSDDQTSCGRGMLEPNYGTDGCITSYTCNTCNIAFEDAQASYNFRVFLVMSIIGLIAIILGIYLPAKTNPLHEWVGTGFMFGGLISIFVGTARFFSDLHRVLKPIVIFIELLLVIWITYKKLSENNVEKKDK